MRELTVSELTYLRSLELRPPQKQGYSPYPTINEQFLLKRPGVWDRYLIEDRTLWNRIQASGGILAVTSPFRRRLLQMGNWGEPWLRMPADGVRFPPFIASIPMPAPPFVITTDYLVLQFLVPPGYDGVLVGFTHMFTGTGFLEGGGDIHWRVRINRRFPRGMGDMLMSMGSLQEPTTAAPGGIRVQSRQLVQYYVSFPLGADARISVIDSRIICGISGWFYPMEG